MRLTSWLSTFGNFGFNRPPERRNKSRGVRHAASSLEQLEDRALLSTFHVATNGDDVAAAADVTHATAFRSIQAAVNAAASASDGDDEIKVAAGVYNTAGVDEKISIPDNANLTDLVISGGWDATFTIQTPQATTYIPTTPTASGADGDIDVADANTTITGIYFVFDGNGVGGTGGTRISGGFVVQATGVTISNNTIEIGGNPNTGARSTGIQTASSDTSNLTISGNTITANGQSLGQGIFLNPGIATNTVIDGNTFTGASYGNMIVVKERGEVTISDNTMLRSGTPIGFNAIDVRSGASATPITNLVITGNTIDGGGTGRGIILGEQSGAGTQAITGFVVSNNLISNHIVGILIGDGAVQPNDISGTISYNSITGNSTAALYRSPGVGITTVDASRNWWGDVSGPSVAANPGGLGQPINDTTGIKFAPWLIYSPDSDPVTPGVQLPLSITVSTGGDVSAADNDFTRLQNAVGALAAGQTLDIQGVFDWTQTNSSAAYLASTNTSAFNDTRGVVVPGNVDNLTITSTGSTARIIGQGDLLGGIYETFLFTADGVIQGNDNLTIENLDVDNFEGAFILGFSTSGVFNGTTIQNNTVHLDGDAEGTQNFGVYLTAGVNQSVLGNVVTFDGDGTSADINGPRSYGFQNTTTGGAAYDGLLISGNTFQLGAAANGSEAVYGVRENSHNDDDSADISITNNSFLGTVTQDFGNALMLTSQTSGLVIDGNIFTDVDNVFLARDGVSGTEVGDEFTISNSVLTRVGGADGVFLRNVTTDAITTVINWNINNSIDGFTGVRGLNELSVQATGTDRSALTGASDLNAVNAIGIVTSAYVDDNFAATGRFTDPDGIGSGLGPIATGFNTFNTIAAGIAATQAGGTVNVLEGTYAESPVLSDNLTLLLAGDVTVDSLDNDVGTTVNLQSFTLTLGDNVGDNTLAGVVLGVDGALVKTGTDTLTVLGTDTYTGTTTVNGGVLLVNGTTTSATTVNSGATLGGSGTIAGPVTVASGGTLAPGNSPGIIRTGDLTLVAGSTFAAEVNGSTPGTEADEVVVNGDVDVTGATLATTGTIASFPGQVVTLIDNLGSNAVTGTFAGLAEGATVTINGLTFTLSYVGGTGNDVTLTETSAVFTIDDVTVNEVAGTLDFTVTLDKALDIDVTVTVTFADNTATGGNVDYTSTTQQVTFLAGETSHTVSVPITDDGLVEATEDFFASLSTSTDLGGRVVNFSDTGTGTITDNDSASVSIAPIADGAETDTPTNGRFRVTLSAPSSTDTVVTYSFGGTATPGSDYTSLTGSVTIPAGDLFADITVAVLNDPAAEDTETVIVTLTGFTSADAEITLDPIPANLAATVNITDDDALIITSGATASIPENTPASTVIIDVNTNETPGHAVNFQLSGPDAALFAISATGEVTFLASPDYENPLDQGADNVYHVTVTATADFVPPKVATQDLTITVTPINDGAPVITSSASASVNENTPASTVVLDVNATDTDVPAQTLAYSLSGIDAALFSIDSATGEIRFLSSPDFENPLDDGVNNVYNVTVTVTDSGTPTSSTTQDLTIIVTAVNDNTPVITSPATASVAENTPISTVVLNVDASDTDIPPQTLTYSLSGLDAALFAINSTTGEITFLASPDYEAPGDVGGDNVYNVTVTVTDNGVPTNAATQDLTITVTPVNDNSPVFVDASPNFSIPENSAVGTVVGSVTATDADSPAQSLTYSIVSGNESGAFTIDPATGEITVADSTPLNFEVTPQFTLVVRVTDNGSPTPSTADATVVIDLTNVQEGAVLTIPNPQGTYHIGSVPAFISPDATFTYEDVSNPNYAGAQVTVSIVAGRGKRDKLSVFRKGDGNNEIDVKGRRIYFNGELIGKSKGGKGAAHPDLVITLTGSATTAAVDNLVRRLNFEAKGDVGTTRTINVQVTNIAGVDSNVATRDIDVVN